MNFGLAFSFPFQDPDWAKKILIPALIGLIPILGQIFLLGWALDITRRVIRQDPTPLPDLDFGRQIVDGFKGLLVGLVYAIPVFILIIPVIIVSAATGGYGSMDEDTASAMFALVTICCNSLILIYSMFMMFVLPASYAHMVARDNLGAAFQLGEIFQLVRSAPGAYLLVLLGMLITGFIGGLGGIVCFVGVVLTYTYAMAVNGHLYGQAYNEATRNQGFAKAY